MSSKSLLMSPMDLQLPPTPPMDLSDSNSNSSNDYKVSFGCITKSVQLNVSHENARENKRGKFREPPPSCARLIRIVHWVTYPMPDAIAACAQTRSRPLSSQRALCKRFFHVHAIAKDASLNRPLNSSRTKHTAHTEKKKKAEILRCLRKDRRNHASETAKKYPPSRSHQLPFIASTHLSAVFHVNIFCFRLWTHAMTYDGRLYIYQVEANAKWERKEKKRNALHTHWMWISRRAVVVVYARWGLLKLIQASASRM